MQIAQGCARQRRELAELQAASLRTIAPVAAVIGYAWFLWIDLPGRSRPAPPGAWVGLVLLILSATLCYFVSKRHLRLAGYLLVWGLFSTAACVSFTYPSPLSACLFVPPVIISSTLLGQWTLAGAPTAAGLLTVATGALHANTDFVSSALPAMAIIGLVSLAGHLSSRNLYAALSIAWHGLDIASRNEQAARERQGELRRVLKALDEATYRIERTNYMLTLARDQAEEARRLKQSFAQTISHELRTPLNLIVGFTALMTESPQYYKAPLPAAYARDLRIVHRNACHLQSLVNDVLDLARIDAAQMSLLPEETDPIALAHEAANTMRGLVESRGLQLLVQTADALPLLWADPVRVRQVLLNLINNAIRFTESGTITISIHQSGDSLLFSVSDTGTGIAAEDLPRIFEEFQQLDASTRRQHSGAGLGLAISRRFVELHGGRIWAESEVGHGSTFFFSLPLQRIHPATVPEQPAEVRLAPAPDRSDRLLLAITESPAAAALLTRYVRGCRTMAVRDLEQARQAVQRVMPQAIVIDTNCTAYDAPALLDLAKAWGLPSTPFLACPLPGEESARQRLAANGYLVKPVTQKTLFDALRQFGDKIDRVLVVDDDQDFVELLARMLDSPLRRYQVIRAYSGEEGLASLHEEMPDLVLLDLALPGIDGKQVIQRIRTTPEWRHLPIIVVSAQEEIDSLDSLPGTIAIAKAAGFRPGEVVQWVQKALGSALQG